MTTPEAKVDAKSFDLDAFLGNFTAPNWKVRIPTRGDLLVEIERLRVEIAAIEAAESGDEAVGDGRSKTKLITEHNKLVDQFEAENVEFTFRPTNIDDHITARANAQADGLDLSAEGSAERLLPYQWAVACVEPAGITAQAFIALRERVGDAALGILHAMWLKANNGGGLIEAPFSPKSLPTPTTAARSRR
ncbi:hypothetical protein [Nakamurella lactea]|uniref:hypothetical protein n=1 Tax=Nakamurella lactea TaxID=459515 RepID=UPI0004074779|nr:hypothetical protein [Nakamurella lactea]